MEATMIDFRNRMADIQAAVSRRERVTVTPHGRPWTVLVAWEDCRPETLKTGETLLSWNKKHFKEVALLFRF